MRLLLSLVACASFAAARQTFGTGISAAAITKTEQTLFNYTLSQEAGWGTMNEFWITGSPDVDHALIQYYVDGEAEASIAFIASYAHGVGFDDQTSPWAAGDLFGKGSATSAWWNHIKIPFYKSIRVTYMLPEWVGPDSCGVYIYVRGLEEMPIEYEGVSIPTTSTAGGQALLQLQIRNQTLQPLDFLDIVSVPSQHSAYILFDLLSFASAPDNENNLEGCFRLYTNDTPSWPGILLSTGTEDYYLSSYYFETPGNYYFPTTGLTHKKSVNGSFQFSAYHTHLSSPLLSNNGIRLNWRNGDMNSPTTGEKCFTQSGGKVVGNPGPAQVVSYGWVYVW